MLVVDDEATRVAFGGLNTNAGPWQGAVLGHGRYGTKKRFL
jgi:hypothetical protein